MKRLLSLLTLAVFCVVFAFAQTTRHYETVDGDPFGTKIYTLDNGLKVYMSVYKDAPRIQTYVAVRVGSKNDPAETTGLAHYLEHLMFKGTDKIGTMDWEHERPLLEEIERQFEVYRSETDPDRRTAIYHVIDSLSYVASGYAIPNEYVKLMKLLGSKGTNAWTSNDNTVYVEDIPSNQLDNWARIQGERFGNHVFRLFHTELETVYEEKNRSLTSDSRKASEAMLAALFPGHPYGTQTTLGTSDHLKNPSLTNIGRFVDTYYVPNNMAIILAGDFDPDEAVASIEKYFGQLPAKPLPAPVAMPAATRQPMPAGQRIQVDVTGLEAPFVNLAFRIGKPANAKEMALLDMLDYVLSNGKCGLIDLNINQKQLTDGCSSYPYGLCDNSAFVLRGRPKNGQSLEDVEELLLQQLQLVCKGDFDDALLSGACNNMRRREMSQLESNSARASKLLGSFTDAIPWKEACKSQETYAKITKEDVVKFANEYFANAGYVAVYKHQGTPEEVNTVVKPPITPIQVNRDAESEFFQSVKKTPVKEIVPVFPDFDKQIQTISLDKKGNAPILCVKNVENQTFSLQIVFQEGELTRREMPIATSLVDYLGTDKLSAEEVKKQFYQMACSFNVNCGDEESYIHLSGLSENFEPALNLALQVLRTGTVEEKVFKEMIESRIKHMEDAKSNQEQVLSALRIYGEYGPELVNYSMNPAELRGMSASQALDDLHHLLKCMPEFRYYGPLTPKQVKKSLALYYTLPQEDATSNMAAEFENQPVTENIVLFVPYDAKQARLVTYSRGPQYDREMMPIVTMYNQYFGGGMNAIVFQEMREKRSLAYTAQSSYIISSKPMDYTYNYSFIGTQNDKIIDAWLAFDELFNDMPVSEAAFELAKENAKTNIAATRTTKGRIIASFVTNRRFNFSYDRQKFIYESLDGLTLQDVIDFNHRYIQNQPKIYMILAREKDVDFEALEKNFGPVKRLSLEEIFGY